MRKLLIVACLLFWQSSFSQRNDKLIKVTDMLRIKQQGNETLTKDGKMAAFTLTITESDPENKLDYKNSTQIYIVNTDKAAKPRQLTASKESAGQPAWSPDGKSLAFVRTVDLKPQVFIISMQGGEAMQLTKYKYGGETY